MSRREILLPWVSQPQEAVRLADSLPAGTIAYCGGQGRLLGGPTYAEVGTISSSATPSGVASIGGTTGSYIDAGRVDQALVGYTWVAQLALRSATQRYISGTIDTGTNALEDLGVNVTSLDATSAGVVRFGIRDDGGSTRISHTTSACLVADQVHTIVAQITSANVLSIWVDGVSQSLTYNGTSSVGGAAGVTDFPLAILNRNVRGAFTGGGGVDLLLYLRTKQPLDGAKVSATLASPWEELFEPQRIWVPASAAGGPPTLAAITASNLTASGARLTVT